MYNYQRENTLLSLRDGLQEFRDKTGFAEKTRLMTPVSRLFLERHDIVHIVFGLDSSFDQEAMVDYWTFFGTTASFRELLDYLKMPEGKELVADLGIWSVIMTAIKSVPNLFRVYWASRKLRKKWPWKEYQPLLDEPLCNIRDEYGVSLVRA